MTQVLLISGSPTIHSHTSTLLREMDLALQNIGSNTTIFDLAKTALPFLDPRYEGVPSTHPSDSLKQFASLSEHADGLVVATPTYHNSYSGVLKNALDWLGEEHFRYKAVVLMCNSGGMRSLQALDHIRIVIREMMGIVVPSQVASCDADYIRTDSGFRLRNSTLKERITATAQEMTAFIESTIRLRK